MRPEIVPGSRMTIAVGAHVDQSFQDWMKQLRRVAVQRFGWDVADALALRDADWRFYFQDGCSPEGAIVLRDELAEPHRTAR
jgi:hypothetical protein